MDGRMVRRWWLSGCLVAGALGCNRNAVQSPWGGPTAAPPVTGMPATTAKKPFWGSGSPTSPPTIPIDAGDETVRKGPPMPETLVAFADVQLEAAFDEKTVPASRQELLDRARQGYQKALQQDSKNKAAMLGLARYYTRTGEREKAVDGFKKYLTANPSDKLVAHEVAMAHAQWKDWPGAVAWCDFTLKLDPENLTVRKTKAFCLARAGDWERGLQVMCEVMPEAQARYLMARVLEHQNQLAASRQQVVMALKADPNYADAQAFLVELDHVLSGATQRPQYQGGLMQAGFNQEP